MTGGGSLEATLWVEGQIAADYRGLKDGHKLTLLVYADGPGAKPTALSQRTGIAIARQREIYKDLKDAGLLEAVAKVFYGDRFEDAVKSGLWSE